VFATYGTGILQYLGSNSIFVFVSARSIQNAKKQRTHVETVYSGSYSSKLSNTVSYYFGSPMKEGVIFNTYFQVYVFTEVEIFPNSSKL
jgi:hypothetical protein